MSKRALGEYYRSSGGGKSYRYTHDIDGACHPDAGTPRFGIRAGFYTAGPS